MTEFHNLEERQLEDKLAPWFSALKRDQAERDPEKAESGKIAFLSRVAELASGVSESKPKRLNYWIPMIRKEPIRMSTIATFLVIFVMLLGGAGTTVFAAQTSLPDQPLYGLKIASEAVRLELTTANQERLELTLRLADQRVIEIKLLIEMQAEIPPALATRWEAHVREAFRLVAQKSEQEFEPGLLLLQQRLRNQETIMRQLNSDDPTVARIRSQIQACLEVVQSGLEAPVEFQYRLRNGDPFQWGEGFRNQNNAPERNADQTPGRVDDSPCRDCESRNPWVTVTPTPHSSYGPGPGECVDCDLKYEYEHEYEWSGENNPWTTGTPTPGSGYGPGNCTEGCEPQHGGTSGWGVTKTATASSGYSGSGASQGPGPTQQNNAGGPNEGGGGKRP